MKKAKRILHTLFLPAFVFLFAGCASKIENLTPAKVPANPSGIYTLSAKADLPEKSIVPSSIEPYVVVDGERRRMNPSELGDDFYDYDYELPENREGARFYYLFEYQLAEFGGGKKGGPKTVTSDVHTFEVEDRYSISLDTNRAPTGTRLAVLGRGFSRNDQVVVGEKEAETDFVSKNTLQFIVPDVKPGQSHPVRVRGGGTLENAGNLRVDPGSPLRVVPSKLELEQGERQAVAFALENPAPADGLPVDVRTDIPDSIIMPEVLIPGGSRTVNVTVQGGEPGQGSLYVTAPGMREQTIPVTVE